MWPVFGIGIVVLGGILTFIVLSHHPMFRMTSRTMGEVVGVVEEELAGTIPKKHRTRVTFRFAAGKRTMEFSRTFAGQRAAVFAVGKKFEVYYSPATPSECRVVTPDLG